MTRDISEYMDRFLAWDYRKTEIAIAKEDLAAIKPDRCGMCTRWMGVSCIPEKKYKQFKSCDSRVCDGFEKSPHDVRLLKEREDKLKELLNPL